MAINVDWNTIKSFVDERSVFLQFIEDDRHYTLAAFDGSPSNGPNSLQCIISKTDLQNPDLIDFETNYKPYSNISPEYSQARHMIKNFSTLGGGVDLDVNGSITPVEFKIQPDTEEIYYITGVALMLLDSGIMLPNIFGAIAALTNGLRLDVSLNNEVTNVFTIKDNTDVAMVFSRGSAGSSNLLGVADGFLNSNDMFFGSYVFPSPVILFGNRGDHLKFVVSDNLVNIDTLKATCMLWKR